MRPEDILELLRTRPFQPFRISLSDGRQFDVRHPELAMVGRSRVIVGIADTEGPDGTFDRTLSLSLRHITSTEVIDGSASVH